MFVLDENDTLPGTSSPNTDKFDDSLFLKVSNNVSKESSNSRSVDLEAELTSNTITPTVKAAGNTAFD